MFHNCSTKCFKFAFCALTYDTEVQPYVVSDDTLSSGSLQV